MGQKLEAESIVGIDRERSKVLQGVAFILADALQIPFRDTSFDMVFSTGLLEHFDPKGTEAGTSRAGKDSEQRRVHLDSELHQGFAQTHKYETAGSSQGYQTPSS